MTSGPSAAWIAVGASVTAILAAALVIWPLWTLLLVFALGGLVAIFAGWPVVPFLTLHAAALTTRYRMEVGPVSIRAEHIAVLVIAGLLAWRLADQRRWPMITLPGWFALAWWVMNVVGTVANAPNPNDSLRHIIRLFLMVLTYLVTVNLIRTHRQWRIAAWGYLILGALESTYGVILFVLQPLGIRLGLQKGHHVPIWTPYGTLEEGNIFGSHSAAWALAFLMLLLTLWHTRRRWWYLAGLVVTGLATIVSLSRGAWIGATLGVALVFLLYSRTTHNRWRHAALLLIIGPLAILALVSLAWVAPESIPFIGRLRTFARLGADPTFTARLQNYSWALSEWRQHPWVGWGPGAFYQLHGLIRAAPAWISNLTVRTLHETGLFGALFFYGWVSLALALTARATRKASSLDRALLLGLAVGFLSLLTAYHATDGTWLAAVWVHVGLMVAGALAILRERPA